MLHETVLDRSALDLLEEYCKLPFLEKELESYYGIQYFKRGQLSNALFTTIKNINFFFQA